MEERATEPPAVPHHEPSAVVSGPPPDPAGQEGAHRSFPSGTYVVQIPKDQIYRVPPPNNARIVELHRSHQSASSKRSGCCKCFTCLFILLVLVLVATGIAVGLSILFTKPKNPTFEVDNLVLRSTTKSHIYDIKLDALNPNPRTGILYKQGGTASLRFKGSAVANGKYPSQHQGKKTSAVVLIMLDGSNSTLPEEITKSLKSGNRKVRVSFLLDFSVPVRMTYGFASERNLDLAVVCNFTMDSLAQDGRVLSQNCQTNERGR